MMRYLLAIIVLFLSVGAYAQTITSASSGFWDEPGTWVGGVVPTSANSTVVSIAVNHAIVVRDNRTANGLTIANNANSSLTISSGGVLSISGGLTLGGASNRGRLFVSGVLEWNDGSSFVGGNKGNLDVQSGGVYRMNYSTGGIIYNVDFLTGSTLEFTGYTDDAAVAPTLETSPKTFHHVTWNCEAQGNDIDLNGLVSNVNGNFNVLSTGSGWFLMLTDTDPANVSIGGDLNIANDTYLYLSGYGGNADVDCQVFGNINITLDTDYSFVLNGSEGNVGLTVMGNVSINSPGAQLVFAEAGGDATINLAGNWNNTSGVLYSSGVGNLVFSGNSEFTQTDPIASPINFLVENGAVLNLMGENYLGGSGSFTLQGGATLGVKSMNGLVRGNGSGNIRVTGARNYQPGGNIIYSGVTQNLGNEWGALGALNGVAVNLEITNGAVLSNNNIGSTSLVGVLSLTNGRLNIGNSNTITIQGVFNTTPSGTIGGSSTANLTFAGSGSLGTLYFAPGAESLNNLTVGRTETLALGSNLTVNTINLSFGDLDFSNRSLTVIGSSISSAGTGFVSNELSNLTFGGFTFSGSVPFSGSDNELNNLTISTPGGVFNWNSNVTVLNRVELTAGTINHSSGLTMGSNSTFSRSGGTIAMNSPDAVTSYNVEYTGGVTTGLELPATANELNNLTINSSGAVTLDKDITVNGNVNLSGSTFAANGFDITLASPSGTWTRSGGSFTGGSGVLTVVGNITIVAPSSVPNFTNIAVNSGASLTLSTGILNIGGNLVNNGTINRSTSTVNFNNNTTISGSSATTFNNITVSGTLVAPSATTLGVAGNFVNTGTFTHNNGTVTFSGTTTISGAAASNFFHVNITGTLTAPSANPLGIAGDFTNNGTFNHNNGTILFNGTVAAQTVSGAALTVNNINVTNPITPGVRINNTTRLNGVCTLIGGAYFDADGTGSGVFIVSSSSQTAGGRIAALPTPANFTGAVTIERYVHGRAGGDYRYLSMPITTNANVGVWRNSMFVTGNFSDRSTNADNSNITNSGNTNPSVYTYNSTTDAYVGVSGGGGLTTATPVSSRVGYSVYDFNNGSVTISYRGIPEKGSVPISIASIAGRFNLVPNPYPSPIDWDNVTKTNVTDAVYLRIDNNVFSSYVGGIATNPPFGGWSGEVATGQAFFVVSSGTGSTFTLTEASKTNNGSYFMREQAPNDYFRIKLEASNDAFDEVVIRFAEGATDQFDGEYDAPKMWNKGDLFPFSARSPYVNMASYLSSPEDAYSINTVDILKGEKIIRLSVTDLVAGTNKLTFSELDKLTKNYNVVLVDNYRKHESNVTDGFEYEFTIDDNALSSGATRFHLRINGAAASNLVTSNGEELFGGAKIYPNPVVDILSIELSEEQQNNLRSIELVSTLGVQITSSDKDKRLLNSGVKTIDMSTCSGGVYLLNIKYGEIVKSIRILKK